MIDYKDESTLFGVLYEMSGVFGFAILLLVGFVFTLPVLCVGGLIAFYIMIKEKIEKRGSDNGI